MRLHYYKIILRLYYIIMQEQIIPHMTFTLVFILSEDQRLF